MTYVKRLLIALILLVIGFLGYSFFQARQELFKVYDVPEQYEYAPKGADVPVVLFEDFTSDQSRQLHKILKKAVDQDGHIIYIPRPVPLNDPIKTLLASAIYAAGEQGKMIEMHDRIYDAWPVYDEQKLIDIAKDLGLDTHKFSRDLRSDKVRAMVNANQSYYEAWAFRELPVLLVDHSYIYLPSGTLPSSEELVTKFEAAR